MPVELTLPRLLIAVSAAIIGTLGLLHIWITLAGRRLEPRDEALLEKLQQTTLRITRETTFWKAWIGFNHSHSLGAILFAAVYLYLALLHGAWFEKSVFLLGVGSVALITWLVLAKRYWFRVPLSGILLANASWFVAMALLVTD